MASIALPLNRPKICILSTTPLIVHFFLRRHIQELAKFTEIILVINPENDSYTPTLDLPVRIIPVKIQRRIKVIDDCLTVGQLYSLFRREKPDLVWAIAPKAGLLGMLSAWLAGIRHRVFIFQGEVWATRVGLGRQLLKTADKLTAICATQLLAVSQSEVSFLEKEGVVPPGKATVLGSGSISGVNLARFRSDLYLRRMYRSAYNIPENAVICLFLGRLTFDKGIADLAAAFAEASKTNADLWLVFAGPEEDKAVEVIRSICREAADRLVICGFTDKPEAFLAMADFLCLPSYREGFGMVILEAGAVGIPAIGSRIYGIVDAISEDKTGLLFTVGDVTELSRQMCRLVQEPELREALGSAAKQRVAADFMEEDVVKRYVDFFTDVLATK